MGQSLLPSDSPNRTCLVTSLTSMTPSTLLTPLGQFALAYLLHPLLNGNLHQPLYNSQCSRVAAAIACAAVAFVTAARAALPSTPLNLHFLPLPLLLLQYHANPTLAVVISVAACSHHRCLTISLAAAVPPLFSMAAAALPRILCCHH